MSAYRLTSIAEAEIAAIIEFIADRDGVDRALGVHDTLVEAFETLASSPGMGSSRPHITPEDVRWWPVAGFQMIYGAKVPVPIYLVWAVPLRPCRRVTAHDRLRS